MEMEMECSILVVYQYVYFNIKLKCRELYAGLNSCSLFLLKLGLVLSELKHQSILQLLHLQKFKTTRKLQKCFLILHLILASERTGKHTISNKLLEVVVRSLVVIELLLL